MTYIFNIIGEYSVNHWWIYCQSVWLMWQSLLRGEWWVVENHYLTSYQQTEQYVHGLHNLNITVIILKQVASFVLPPYYIYNAIHLSIKGWYIMVWWAINYTNDNIATLLLMTLFYFNEDWFTIFTKIGQVWSLFEINMILNTKCHPPPALLTLWWPMTL